MPPSPRVLIVCEDRIIASLMTLEENKKTYM
jgi:hypothetical protein